MIKQRMFPLKPGARKQNCGVDPAQRAGVKICNFIVMFSLRDFSFFFLFLLFLRGGSHMLYSKYGTDGNKNFLGSTVVRSGQIKLG